MQKIRATIFSSSVTDPIHEMTFADVGLRLGVTSEELDCLVELGYLRPFGAVHGAQLFLRSDVERVTPYQISIARSEAAKAKKRSG